MKIIKKFRRFLGRKQYHIPIFVQQATYLQQASSALCKMMEVKDVSTWKQLEREVKACEVQGDALLAEFYEDIYENIITTINRSEMQTIAVSIDEFLDGINDSAKSILLYHPERIDQQLDELAQYIHAEAAALKEIINEISDVKKNYSKIAVQCDRITELEHAADDAYEEYIAFIFKNEKNAIELIKYKNIAETLEATTDAAKRVSDNVRKIILRYIE